MGILGLETSRPKTAAHRLVIPLGHLNLLGSPLLSLWLICFIFANKSQLFSVWITCKPQVLKHENIFLSTQSDQSIHQTQPVGGRLSLQDYEKTAQGLRLRGPGLLSRPLFWAPSFWKLWSSTRKTRKTCVTVKHGKYTRILQKQPVIRPWNQSLSQALEWERITHHLAFKTFWPLRQSQPLFLS